MTFVISGCSTTQQRIDTAGAVIGASAARVDLEPWPAYCWQNIPHAAMMVGDELSSVHKRERGQLDAANARARECGEYYEGYRQRLADGN